MLREFENRGLIPSLPEGLLIAKLTNIIVNRQFLITLLMFHLIRGTEDCEDRTC